MEMTRLDKVVVWGLLLVFAPIVIYMIAGLYWLILQDVGQGIATWWRGRQVTKRNVKAMGVKIDSLRGKPGRWNLWF